MNEKDRWLHRRTMTWLAVLAGLLYPVLIAATGSKLIVDIAVPFYTFVLGISSSYIGFATLDDKWKLGDMNDKLKNNGAGNAGRVAS